MNESPKGYEAQNRLKLFEFQVRAYNGETIVSRKRVYVNEGTRRSVMLNDGPVNKNKPTSATKGPNEKHFYVFVPSVALLEPGNDRETFAARDWNNFVKRVGRERD